MVGGPPDSDSDAEDLPPTDCFPANRKKSSSVSWGPNRCFSPISWVSSANANHTRASSKPSTSNPPPVKMTQDSENGSSSKYSVSDDATSPVTKVSVAKTGPSVHYDGVVSPRTQKYGGPKKSYSAPLRRPPRMAANPAPPRAATAKARNEKGPAPSGSNTPISVMDLHVRIVCLNCLFVIVKGGMRFVREMYFQLCLLLLPECCLHLSVVLSIH